MLDQNAPPSFQTTAPQQPNNQAGPGASGSVDRRRDAAASVRTGIGIMGGTVATGATTSTIFCRHCGYNLYGLPQNKCPECGRPFDPNNSKTYSKHAGSPSRRRWARRIVASVVALILLAGVGGLSLWWPWHREQAAVRMIQRCGGIPETNTVGPQWLRSMLGQRGSFLLERLAVVVLYGSSVTDTDLASLEGLSGLLGVHLSGTHISDAGLAHLRGAKSLISLELNRTQVTDAGLEHLRGLKGLQTLSLAETQVTDAGLEHLKDLKELQTLHLEYTQITDAGLGNLKELKRLQWLNLGGTKVTDAGVAALKRALPGCVIYH